MFNVFHVSNKSLKLMFTCRNMIQFRFFMTSIYTWDPLSRSYDSPKSKVKRILMARHYVSKKLEIPIALEIHFLIHRTSWKHKWRGYSWLDNMLQNFKGFLLHLRSTFSFTGPPESANEEDTCGSKICSKNKPIYYTWDPISCWQDCLKSQVKMILVAQTQLILRSLTMTKIILSLCLN